MIDPVLFNIYKDFENMLRMVGFDDCISGVVERYGSPDVLCYDLSKVIDKLMRRDGMTEEEAYEFWEYNQLGAWMGEQTPCFIRSAE